MKKILAYLACFHLLLLFSGCEKEIMEYKGREGVYFAVRHGNGNEFLPELWPYQRFSRVEFTRLAMAVVDLPLKVAITGPVKDYDRTFKVEINPDSTDAVLGQHYEALQPEWTIPAGQVSTNVVIRLKRSLDLQNVERKIGLRLVPSKDFALAFPEWDGIPSLNQGVVDTKFDNSLHKLILTDVMVTPVVWSGSIQPGNVESGLLGIFSRRKMDFLSENLGVKYEDFANTDIMPMARMFQIANDATAILIARKAAGNPVLEADGRLMWLGTVPWTSIIGVPYVP